jgi:small subunit ribosomal protein S1
MSTNLQTPNQTDTDFASLLEDKQYVTVPKVGDVVSGRVVSASKNEVHLDLGFATGIIRGKELYNESPEYNSLTVGDVVEATVVDGENELGELELSFRYAGQVKSWEKLQDLSKTGDTVDVEVVDANKGGLMIRLNHIPGFLPVSQLNADHYPRVPGGDKVRILEKLKSFIGEKLRVKVLDADSREEKLIVSEKKIEEDAQVTKIAEHNIGETCEGEITAITDFGAFMQFAPDLVGLIHISELAWQRVDNPADVVKVGDKVKAQIINISGPKVFLSIKRLLPDPWQNVGDKYKVGDRIKGIVKKINSFGLFVELDDQIHGLAHASELGMKPEEVAEKIKVDSEMEFTIVSIKPDEYRLGLSLTKKPEDVLKETEKTEDKQEEVKEEAKTE